MEGRCPLPAGNRYAGARGRLKRADSGFYTHGRDLRFSITIRQHMRNSSKYWTPIPYCGAADVAEPPALPSSPGAAHRRRDPPSWPSSPPTAITASSPTGTGRRRLNRECHGKRRRADNLPSGRFAPSGWRYRSRPLAAVWAKIVTTLRTGLRSGGTDYPLGAPIDPASGPGRSSSAAPWHGCRDSTSSLTARSHPTDNRTSPPTRGPLREGLLLRPLPTRRSPPCPTSADGHKVSLRRLQTDTGPLYPKSCPDHRLPLPLIALSAVKPAPG